MKRFLSAFISVCLCFSLFSACESLPNEGENSKSSSDLTLPPIMPNKPYEIMYGHFQKEGDALLATRKELVSLENPKYSLAFSPNKLTESSFAIELTVALPNTFSSGGIFFNAVEKYTYTYEGYAFMISRNYVTLQKLTILPEGGFNAVELGKRAIETVASNTKVKLRVERKGDLLFLYYLDDYSKDLVPWPEIELSASELKENSGLGIIDNGGGCSFEALTHYNSDALYDHGVSGKGTQFTNPVYDENHIADPQMIKWNGKFYCYATSAGGGFSVLESEDMINWTYKGRCLETGWNTPAKRFWAPEVFIKDNKFYMIFSNADILGLAVADDPLGPFTPMEKPLVYDAIDGHVFFDDDGKVYLYYVSWGENRDYGIYGCELKSDLSAVIPNTETLLLKPKSQWELQKEAITEGPYILKHNGTYYLTYSGSHYTDKHYAVGYATSTSPLGDYKRYHGNPILSYTNSVNGPGHHSFITVGNEMFIVYHAHSTTEAFEARNICIDRIRFAPTKSGVDRIEIYGPTRSPQNIPNVTK